MAALTDARQPEQRYAVRSAKPRFRPTPRKATHFVGIAAAGVRDAHAHLAYTVWTAELSSRTTFWSFRRAGITRRGAYFGGLVAK